MIYLIEKIWIDSMDNHNAYEASERLQRESVLDMAKKYLGDDNPDLAKK